MNNIEKLVVSNRTTESLGLCLEPWGEDYTLMPEETVEVIALNCTEEFHYQVEYQKDCVLVWAEGDRNAYPRLFKDGVELKCGYNQDFS